MFLGVFELKITAKSTVLTIFNRQKGSKDFFSFNSSFTACFRDSTKKCVLAIHVDIEKSSPCMPDSVTDFATQYITSCNDFWPSQKIRNGVLGLAC